MTNLVRTPFAEDATAAEVISGVDLSGKRAIVTGGNSGIGYVTSHALASAGADVTIVGRSIASCQNAASAVAGAVPGGRVAASRLDLADLDSVAQFVREWDSQRLDILVNNAGIMA